MVLGARNISYNPRGLYDNVKSALIEFSDNSVEVVAEVYFQPFKDIPVKALLLGKDGKLYDYDDLEAYLRPFGNFSGNNESKGVKRFFNLDPETVDDVLEHSKVEWVDRKEVDDRGRYHTTIVENDGYQMSIYDLERATKEAEIRAPTPIDFSNRPRLRLLIGGKL